MAALSVGASKSNSSALVTILKITASALVVFHLAAFLFGVMFGLLAWPRLQSLLNSGGLPTALSDLGVAPEHFGMLLISLASAPLGYALMTAIFPFIGAWLYLSIPDKKTTGIGLGVAACFTVVNICINLGLNARSIESAVGPIGALSIAIGFVIAALYVFFFMGIGFNLAKVFKLKAKSDGIDLSSL